MLSQMTKVVTKGTTPTTLGEPFTDSGVNFIKAEALNGDSNLEPHGIACISESTHEKLKRSILEVGDVLVTIAGAQVGKCGFVREEHLPCNTNQAVGIVRADHLKTEPRFLYYFFKQPQTFARCQSIGASQAAQPNVNLTILRGFTVPCPTLERQRHIASILTAYDDLIENNRRRMALLEEAARKLYREWFVRLRFPGHKHTPIRNCLPEGWERKRLGDLCEAIRDISSPDKVDADTPYIGLEHIPRRSISQTDWGHAVDVSSSKHKFSAGDILFGKIRPYFHKVSLAFVDGVASSDAIVIRPKEANFHSLVLMAVSSDAFVAMTAQTMKEGAKMPRADWKQMQAHEVLRPSGQVLEAFNRLIVPITEQLRNLTFQTRKLRTARDRLLPKLMNGEITL